MIMKRFVAWGLAAIAVAALGLALAMYVSHQRVQDQHSELRRGVTSYCETMQDELRSAAEQYRSWVGALAASGSGSELLRAEIVVDETPTHLGGDTTRSGRAATAFALQRRFSFCSGLRGASTDVDALRARFTAHAQVYWQSTDRSAIAQALTNMAKDAAELRLR
jgi:hypothetical protein